MKRRTLLATSAAVTGAISGYIGMMTSTGQPTSSREADEDSAILTYYGAWDGTVAEGHYAYFCSRGPNLHEFTLDIAHPPEDTRHRGRESGLTEPGGVL